jgi:NAD+ kinase
MAGYLRNLFSGGVKPIKLHRLEISIGGHKVEELALNDMLFAHASPAATTRYILRVSGKSEAQRSSGVWVSSAAGSTAAAASAGGKPLPLESKKMEYVVREPYDPSKSFRLLKGVLASGSEVRIESASKHGTVYIDGAGIQYPAPEGTNISARVSERPLNIFWRS